MIKINLKKPNPASYILPSGFLLLGVYLVVSASNKENTFIEYLVITIAFFTTLVSLGSLKVLRNLYFDKNSGLQLDDEKLIYQPNRNQNATIYWSDIKEIKFKLQGGQHFILLIIKDPQKVIASQPNQIGRRVMRTYLSLYKTPILINASIFDYSFEQLKHFINISFDSVQDKGISTLT